MVLWSSSLTEAVAFSVRSGGQVAARHFKLTAVISVLLSGVAATMEVVGNSARL
jgi:hypothetical protein